MKKIPRYFQNEAVRAIIASWKLGYTPCACMSTGSGKALTASILAEKALKQNKRALILVPTMELCQQNFKELAEYTDYPMALGMCCSKLQKFQTQKQAVIATYTSFLSRRARSGAFDLLIIDECFTGDTLISTVDGEKRIDKVRLGDLIYNAYGYGEVKAISKKISNKIYKVRLGNGTEIKTTNNHPIFTQYGWIRSEDLDKRHVIIGIQDMRKLRKKDNSKQKKQCFQNKKRKISISRMGAINGELQNNKILLNKLLETERECYVGGWRKRKDERELKENWSQTSNSWRQRKRINGATKNNDGDIRRWLGSGAANKDKCWSQKWCLSELLQGRHWERKFKNSNRTGRSFTQREKEIARSKKGCFSNFNRVESVQIEESRSDTAVYNLQVSGHPSYFAGGILVHNCHLVSPEPDTSYQKIIRSLKRQNPKMLICGLTATPYRAHGMLTEDSIKGKATFNHLCYETDIARLISEGYLSHVESISGDIEIDLSSVGIKGGDYDTQKMGVKFSEICSDAVKDMRLKFAAYDIKTALIFASTLENARQILTEWGDNNTMRLVYGDMSEHDRKAAIKWMKEGHGNRYIVNVGVLTTGFDFTALECVCLMRATKSLGLYIQMVGRVIRAHDDKEKGYLLDFGTNIERHGSIDKTIPPKTKKKEGDAPVKYCLLCGVENRAAAKKCKECEAEFISENETGLYAMRSKAEALALKAQASWQEYKVGKIEWGTSTSASNGKPMITAYFYEPEDDYGFGTHYFHKQSFCIEHGGTAQTIAEAFFRKLFVNNRDFYELKGAGFTCENLLVLLQDHYGQFFRRIDTLTIGKQASNGKYSEIKRISFCPA